MDTRPVGSAGSRGPMFVGREAEVARVEAFLNEVARGATAMLIIEAEAGGGKSSLLRQTIDRARHREPAFTIFASDGDPNDARSLRCLADALECRLSSQDERRSRIAQLLVGVTGPHVEGIPAAAQELILDLIERRAIEGPVLLVIDDLQWVDRMSLAVLASLQRRLPGLGIGIVAATRPSSQVRSAFALAAFDTLHLGPFDDGDVASLAARATGVEPSSVDVAAFDAVRSNPFLIGVLAANGGASPGQPREGSGDVTVPRVPLTQALGRMTAGLPPALRSFLEVAAIAGRDVDVDVIAQTLDLRVATAVTFVREGVDHGWMSADGETVRFRHDLFCEALVSALPVDRRDRLHLELGRALAELGYAPGRAAFHLDASSYLLDASHVPAVLSVLELLPLDDDVVSSLARRSHELCPADTDALIVRLRCLAARRQHAEVLRLAVPWIDRAGIDEQTRFAIRMLATTSCAHAKNNDEAIALLQGGLDPALLTDTQRADYLIMLARLQWYGRDVEAVRQSAGEALAVSQAGWYVKGQVAALSVLSEAASMQGDPGEALRYAEAAMELSHDLRGPLPATPELAYGTALVSAGRIREGLPVLVRTLLAAERTGDSIALGLAHMAIQSGRLNIGDWDGFEADAVSMIEVGRETGMRSGIVFPLAFEALSACRRGAFERVPSIVARLRLEATIGDSHPTAALGSLISELAEIESDGRIADACTKASWLAGVLAPAGFSVQTQVAMEAARLAWICHDVDVQREMAELTQMAADRASTSTRRAMAAWCAALVDGSADQLKLAARALATTERVWDTAVAMHAAGLAADRENDGDAQGLFADAASRYAALGCPKHAAAARAKSGFEAVFTTIPAESDRAQRVTTLGRLSAAERRVLELVTAGLANGDIAVALFVSKRTVESHVASLYKKLGVTTRVALSHVGATAR